MSTELQFQFGFKSPKGEIVACSSLQEAQFFADSGGVLVLRKIETRTGKWEEVKR